MKGIHHRFGLMVLVLLAVVHAGCGGGGSGGGGLGAFLPPPPTGQLTVLEGTDHANDVVTPGDQNIVLEFLISATNENIIVDSIDIQAFGSGNDVTDITVNLLEDTDNDGEINKVLLADKDIGGGDRLFTSDNGTMKLFLSPPQIIAANAPARRWLFVYSFNSTLPSGVSFGAVLTGMKARNFAGSSLNPTLIGTILTGSGGDPVVVKRVAQVAAGTANPASAVVAPGTNDVPVLHMDVTWPFLQSEMISNMLFDITFLGGASTGDFGDVKLQLDANSDGVPESTLATTTLTGSTLFFGNVDHTVAAGGTDSFLLTVSFGGGMSDMEGLQVSLADQSSIGWEDALAFTLGTPVTGGQLVNTQPVVAVITVVTTTPDEEDQTLLLDGTNSVDPDIGIPGSGILSYQWLITNLVDMPVGTMLTNDDQSIATLHMPNSKTNYSPEIELTIVGTDTTSDMAMETIDVQADDDPVFALVGFSNANPDEEDGLIVLDGSGSFDPDIEDSITDYVWTIENVVHANVTIDDPIVVLTNLNLVNLLNGYTIDIKLVVTSTDFSSDNDLDTVTVSADNDFPTSVIGVFGHTAVVMGSSLQFDSSSSSDPDLDDTLSYQFAVQGTPPAGVRFRDNGGGLPGLGTTLSAPVLDTQDTGSSTYTVGVQLKVIDTGGLNHTSQTTVTAEATQLLALETNADVMLEIAGQSGHSRRSVSHPLGFLNVVGADYDSVNDILYAVDSSINELITIDPATAIGTSVGGLGRNTIRCVAYDSDLDRLWAFDQTTGEMLILSKGDGFAIVFSETTLTDLEGLAYDSVNKLLWGSDGLSLYSIDTDTAVVTFFGVFTGGGGGFVAKTLGYDSSTDELFLIDETNKTVFTVDRSNAVLTLVGDYNGAGFQGIESMAVDPDIVNIYAIDNNSDRMVSFLKTDPNTNSVVGSVGFDNLLGAAFNGALNTVFFSDNSSNRLFSINIATGATTQAPTRFGLMNSTISGLAFIANTLYGTDTANDQLVTIDIVTGIATAVGGFGGPGDLQGLAYNTDTMTMYATDATTNELFTINTATGAVILTVGSTGVSLSGLAYLNGVLYGNSVDTLYSVDIGLGTATPIDETVAGALFTCLASNVGNGDLYTYDFNDKHVLRLDSTDGHRDGGLHMLGFDQVKSLAYDELGDIVYGMDVESGYLVSVNSDTGVATAVIQINDSGSGAAFNLESLAFDPVTQLLWAVDTANDELVTLDPATGLLAVVGAISTGDIGGLAYDEVGQILYGVDQSSGDLGTIDTATGSFSFVMNLTGRGVSNMTFDASQGLLFAVDQINHELITVDPGPKVLTVIGGVGHITIQALVYFPAP